MTLPALRVGIVGTGGIARQHFVGYQEAGAEVVALCDVDAATLQRRCAEWDIPSGHLDYRDLLADPAVDAISICTPNSSHHPITMAAAAARKHVHCEKPVSLDIEQGEEMIAACSKAGVVLQVGHHMRSWAAAMKAKEMIAAGAIGRVTYARFRQAHDWGGSAEVRGVFGSKAASGGGTLLDNGCHLFDLARYLGGDVTDVFARTAHLKFDIEVEDTAVSSLGFESGALGQVEVAWTGTGWQEAFWVFGTEGSLECDNRTTGAGTLVHRYRATSGTTWEGTDVATYELRGLPSHTQHVMNFVAAVRGTGPVVCTGNDGVAAVRLVLASYESAETGSVVKVS